MMDNLLRKICVFLIILGLMLSYANWQKQLDRNRRMTAKEVKEWKLRNDLLKEVKRKQMEERNEHFRHIIDSIKTKGNLTQQDIDFVREHSQDKNDEMWCLFSERELVFDSLKLMRERIGKMDGFQTIAKLMDEEYELFQEYLKVAMPAYYLAEDVYVDVTSNTFLNIMCMNMTCSNLYQCSVEGTLRYLCGKPTPMIIHKKITEKMIDKAYASLIKKQKNSLNYSSSSPEEGNSKEEKQEALRKEQRAWHQWMDFRTHVSELLPDSIRTFYENETNNVKRNKLILLKNQYCNVGVYGTDVLKCCLPDSCTDDELEEYASFSYVWSIYLKHSNDTGWTDWKRHRHYK